MNSGSRFTRERDEQGVPDRPLLRPVIATVLAEFVPDPRAVAGAATVLVDGTICPTWN